MFTDIFPVLYIIGLVTGSVIRVWYSRKYQQDRTAIYRREGLAVGLLASLWGIAIIIPVIHMITDWLDFASYNFPVWAGWVGAAIFAIALWLLWRSHADLGHNWSVTVDTREGQTLVNNGVFKYIRHPMYTAHLLWGIAQVLLITNYIAGPASLVVFLPLYWLRVPREERMLLEQFGEAYHEYMDRTGRIIPRFWK